MNLGTELHTGLGARGLLCFHSYRVNVALFLIRDIKTSNRHFIGYLIDFQIN